MMSQSLILTRVCGADQESKASIRVRGNVTRIKARQWRRKNPEQPMEGKDRMVSGSVTPRTSPAPLAGPGTPMPQPWVPPERLPAAPRPGLPVVPRPPGTELSPLHGTGSLGSGHPVSINLVWAQQLHSAQLQVTAPQTPNAATLDKRHHILRSISKSLETVLVWLWCLTDPALLKDRH